MSGRIDGVAVSICQELRNRRNADFRTREDVEQALDLPVRSWHQDRVQDHITARIHEQSARLDLAFLRIACLL